jgi:hypothetical protein
MNTVTRKGKSIFLLIGVLLPVAAFTALILAMRQPPIHVSAHSGDVFGPACGTATMDGNVKTAEWSTASKKTFQMVTHGGKPPFTATLYVMNSGYYLYLGITINDDEFTTYADYLDHGDGWRIDFDNNHSGTLEALNDDVLGIAAGLPQFDDSYIYNLSGSSTSDVKGGGRSDGAGAASRVGV